MRLKHRIAIHFFTQIFVTFIATFFMLVLFLIAGMHLLAKTELISNPKKAIVENLPYSSLFKEDNHIELNETWQDALRENNIWMQIINEDGKVIYEHNTIDSSLKNEYTINDLLRIEETNTLGNYTVETYFEVWEPQPYYFLFGYLEEQQMLLQNWFDTYGDNGRVEGDNENRLEEEINKHKGMLEIYQDGKLINTIGKSIAPERKPLSIIGSMHVPGNFETKVTVLNDDTENISWVYHELNDTYTERIVRFFSNEELQIIILITLVSLIIPFILSFWNGYRYGKPLLLLINWLKFVEQKQYDTVLHGLEHKKIYRKNGKVKFRYRIYKEVFESFSKLSEKLSLADQERARLEKTREEWMAGISHDLRTPLSSIQGYGHMLESDQYDFSREELQQIGTVIRDKSEYMVDLVNDFSLVFQLKNSAITIQKEQVDINSFIQNAVEKHSHDFTLYRNQITFEPSPISCVAAIDPKWFIRVVDNLLSNAIKHNPPETTIHVKVNCEHDQTIITFTDNGKGIAKEDINKLFNRYYRGTNTTEQTEGEGLGMNIANAIVELHGGKIMIDSKVNKGTEISIIL